MSVNSDNELKWQIGTSEPLTIMGAGMEEFPFGTKYVVRIKPLITGHDHFMPSPGLEKKIKEANIDIGDQITVEKVAPSDKYQYGYFSVDVVQKGGGPQIATDRIEKSPVGAGFAHKDAKAEMDIRERKPGEYHLKELGMVVHELSLRVEKLEKIEETRSSEAGHKPGDEKLPF
jgi:hypothetical protein